MKKLILLAALFAFSAHAQQTNCQVYGNQIYCSTVGGGIQPSIQPNWQQLLPRYQSPQESDALNAQAQLAQQQAYLARQQAEQLRLQTEMLRQQQAELERQRAALAAEQTAAEQAELQRQRQLSWRDKKDLTLDDCIRGPDSEWLACKASLDAKETK